MDERENIKKLLDELPILWEYSKEIKSKIYSAIIMLQKVLEDFLTIETETK